MAVAENGIFEVARNRYSKCYRFQDINYTTATEEEQIGVFERYCKFLNSLDCNYKITVNNKNKDMNVLRDYVLIPYAEDGFNNFRKIYNDIIEEKILEGRQGIEQERYLTLTIERKNFEEAKAQFVEMTGHLPDQVAACVGGGSNSIGMFTPFLADPVELVGVEPLGRGPALGDNAASITYGKEGVMHGFNSIMLADENGDPAPVYSNASGLDYPAAGPEHAMLHDMHRVNYTTVDDEDAIEALFLLSRHEGIIPAIESSHALAYAIRVARKGQTGSILVNLSGRGDKDLDFVVENYGYGPEYLAKMAKRRR
jgi:hypothetical protein